MFKPTNLVIEISRLSIFILCAANYSITIKAYVICNK